MQLSYLASVALMTYGIQAQAPPSPAPGAPAPGAPAPAPAPGGKQPNIIPMNCTGAYMPFSEADVAALSNQTQSGGAGNYSTIPTEAACKGMAGSSVDGLCDLGSCANHPVCNTCVELIITGNTTTTGKTTVPQVTCTNNYFFGGEKDTIKNFCTDGNDKTYTCSGGCQGFTSCQLCISSNDPALKSFQGA